MHCILSNLTAVLLALHTVFGCCWHHAHALAGAADSAPSVVLPVCHDNHPADDCGSNESDSGERHVCQGNTCIFLGPNKWDRDRAQIEIASSPAAFLSNCLPEIIADLRIESTFDSEALLPPLRLHLLDRVLLI